MALINSVHVLVSQNPVMANEYLKPMLDVGSPRVLNCNVITRRILAENPEAKTFFTCKPLNDTVLIKDTDPSSHAGNSIGTKLYLPFNENEIYEGGRTIFISNKHIEEALLEHFGNGALPQDSLNRDMRIMRILDKLPSLDPFLLKDVFINEKIEMNPAYFEVDKALWNQIESYILEGFEPLAKAAFPDALSSDEMARKLIEKIWEGRDLDALKPLVMALRLPQGYELEIFSAWKGIIFYGFQHKLAEPLMTEMLNWLKDVKIPIGIASNAERAEFKAEIDTGRNAILNEWKTAEKVLADYQTSYDKMFKLRAGSADFVKFLQNSSQSYWTLGNCLGKTGHVSYCWDAMTKRHPGRKLPWDQLCEFITLLGKIFNNAA
ncbi:MAG: hypothetical protein KGI97_07345 [Alphaproteobacteria bacterium]|nr:hypothetical protein [Alphaproteobacteria bacterium]